MYEHLFAHFRLRRNPFHGSPDPKRFFSTAAHDAALGQIVFGIENRQGLLVLTGEPGTGKTTILHYLLEWLHQQRYSTAYVFHSLVPSVDLIELILRDFGISCATRNMGDLVTALHEWLLCRHEVGDCPVIVIDEAQALSRRALDELRMLLNLEVPGGKLVQLVLAGQPQLDEKLRHRDLVQLRQRVVFHCKIPVLTLEEAAGYIASRLAEAGATESAIFPRETIGDIFAYSRGVPRVVNLLCEQSMLAAYGEHRKSVLPADVLQVARHFDLVEETELETASPVASTIGRLIPFPKLDPSAAELRLGERDEEWLQELVPADSSLLALASLPVLTGAIRISRPTPRFVLYLREVVGSLIRNCRRILNFGSTWLRARTLAVAKYSLAPLWRALFSGLPASVAKDARGSARTERQVPRPLQGPARERRKRRPPRRMSA